MGNDSNITILWAPILSRGDEGDVVGVIGVVCPVSANMTCEMEFDVGDQLEDFEALFDEDFQLIHEKSFRDNIDHELNYLFTNKETIIRNCSLEGSEQPCLVEFIDEIGQSAEL